MMKSASTAFLTVVFCAALLSACASNTDTAPVSDTAEAVTEADTKLSVTETETETLSGSEEETSSETKEETPAETEEQAADDLWANALYTENAELGEGDTVIAVEVAAGEKSVTLTVHTNEENLGAALTSNALVEGDQSEYGLYIKMVNGIRADYDLDGAYWAISKDGELTPTGADTTAISDGEHYELTYTKG